MAALTILSHNVSASELSLQQNLDIAADLVSSNNHSNLATEGDSEPLMMAQPVPHQATDRKRVKVYELRNNDWFDRGTGFCTASFMTVRFSPTCPPVSSIYPLLAVNHNNPRLIILFFLFFQNEDGRKDPRVVVESEDQPNRILLETRIQREDGFQKQQGKSRQTLRPYTRASSSN